MKTITGTTRDGNRFHQIGYLLVQSNSRGEWHGYDEQIWQTSFLGESAARRWLRANAPKAPRLLPPQSQISNFQSQISNPPIPFP